jgi:hypothetical protein
MSQTVEGTHTTAVGEVRRHHRHRTGVRTDPGAPQPAMSERSRRTLVPVVFLMAVAAIMIAAAGYVFLGEKGIAVSPLLWKVAVDLCRVVTDLFGILAIVSVVTGRRSGSSRDGTFGSAACGALLIAAAVAGLGLVIVITGLSGLALLYAGGAGAVEAFRAS